MNNTPEPAGSNMALWGAIAALGVAVVVMGAMLWRQQSPDTPAAPVVASTAPAAGASAASTQAPVPVPAVAPTAAIAASKAPAKPKTPPPQHTSAPQPVLPATPEPAVAHAPPPSEPLKTYCANCGIVERVMPMEQEGAGSGVGAIAGGVLGALVGNQIGGGSGKSLATVAGAIGGGIAGNTVEKKMNKVTRYEVLIRMEDGSTRTLIQSRPLAAGTHVIVDGNTVRSAAPE